MGRLIRRVIGAAFLIAAIILTAKPFNILNAAGYVDDFQLNHNILSKYTGTANAVSVSGDIASIAPGAFANQMGIYSVDLGNNTREVGEGAFAGCSNLTTVTMHDNMESIGSAAFSGCVNLRNLNIGSGVNSIGYGVLAGCDSLGTIQISPNNKYFSVIGGGLYNKNATILYGFMNGNTSSYLKLPNTVEEISKFSFWGNFYLNTVSLSPALEKIPAYAFANCTNLMEINIPYSVDSIDAKAFENCDKLYELIIPPSVTYIAPTAFDGCTHLKIVADPGTAAYEFYENFKANQSTANTSYNPSLNMDLNKASSEETASADAAESEASTEGTAEETSETTTETSAAKETAEETAEDTTEESAMPDDDAESRAEGTSDNLDEEDSSNSGATVPEGSGADFQESLQQVVPGIGLVDASTDPSNVDYIPGKRPIDNVGGDGLVAKTYVVGGRAVLFSRRNPGLQGKLQGVVNDNSEVSTEFPESEVNTANDNITNQSDEAKEVPASTEVTVNETVKTAFPTDTDTMILNTLYGNNTAGNNIAATEGHFPIVNLVCGGIFLIIGLILIAYKGKIND